MKKLTWLLALAMLMSMLAALPASAEATYTQAPMFDGMENRIARLGAEAAKPHRLHRKLTRD